MPPKGPYPVSLPVTFRVGTHALHIANQANGRWTVSVDDGQPEGTYQTQVEAWEAGVRLADDKDRGLPR